MAASLEERVARLERLVLSQVPDEGRDARTIAQAAHDLGLANQAAVEDLQAHTHSHRNRGPGLCGPPIVEAAARLPEGTGPTITIHPGDWGICAVYTGGTIADPAQELLGDKLASFEFGPGAWRVEPSAIIPDWLRRRRTDIDFDAVDLRAIRALDCSTSPVYWRHPASSD